MQPLRGELPQLPEELSGKPPPKRPHRTKGAKNRSTLVNEAVEEAFIRVGGVEYLVWLAHEDPKTFASLLSRTMPKDLRIKDETPADKRALGSLEAARRVAWMLHLALKQQQAEPAAVNRQLPAEPATIEGESE